jgi:hypothetical protein
MQERGTGESDQGAHLGARHLLPRTCNHNGCQSCSSTHESAREALALKVRLCVNVSMHALLTSNELILRDVVTIIRSNRIDDLSHSIFSQVQPKRDQTCAQLSYCDDR